MKIYDDWSTYMKLRIMALILSISLCFCTLYTGQIVSAAKMRGDIDLDGFTNAVDLLMLKKKIANLIDFNDEQKTQADCNNDGKVDMDDAYALVAYFVKTGELHVDYENAWYTLYDWESYEDSTDSNKITNPRINKKNLTITTKSITDYCKENSVTNDKNTTSRMSLGLKSKGLYYSGSPGKDVLTGGMNPTEGSAPAQISVDTAKTTNASNLRMLLNYLPSDNEISVVYVGVYMTDGTAGYYRLTLESYREFNYFYFAGKEYTNFALDKKRTFLADDNPGTFTLSNNDIKNIRYIYFWMESNLGADGARLIVDDIDYYEGDASLDGAKSDEATFKQPEEPTNDGNTKYMAISFDDGPNVYSATRKHYMEYYLDLAKEYDAENENDSEAKFSYFLIGNNCDSSDVDVLNRALNEGHDIENHTISHDRLSTLTAEQIQAEIRGLDEKLQSLGVNVTTNYLRPPRLDVGNYGDNSVYLAVKDAGIKACVAGPCPQDYEGPSVDYKELYYKKHLGDGSIALFHEHFITNVEVIRRLMNYFGKQGYEFVTVADLFEIKEAQGFTVEYNKTYYKVG